MGERTHQQSTGAASSRRGIKSASGGEIVEVQGGHIVRSTGRKDRHSKVCTAKGPRDRRVRLAAHTAIQFYDVQDRLGYDRPSKAVDWLIKKAKTSIDELEKLPAWNPSQSNVNTENTAGRDDGQEQLNINEGDETLIGLGNNSSNFVPPSMNTDSIVDTIKSFFPTCGAETTPSSTIDQFQTYPPDLLSRTSSQNQDLRLSLQFVNQDQPILVHTHHQTDQIQIQEHHQNEHVLFSRLTAQLGGFDSNSTAWTSEHQNQPMAEIDRFHKFIPWNKTSAAADTGGSDVCGSGGFFLNSQLAPSRQTPPPPPLLPYSRQFFGESQLFSQRGPLQSSNTPTIPAWIDPLSVSDSYHRHQNYQIPPPSFINQLPSSLSGFGFGGFSGFHTVPDRVEAQEDQHDGFSHDKPSSANSSGCRH